MAGSVNEDEIVDLLEVLDRMGARFQGKAVLIQMAKTGCAQWSEDHFWDVAQAAETQGYIEPHRNGYVVPTLTGTRLVEARLRPPPNVTNNSVSIRTNVASPIQQAGAHSRPSQTASYQGSAEQLSAFASSLRANLNELGLSEADERKARAQLATIDAQLEDEPDPVIVRQAGRTLRNVTEGAIGSLLATGATQPAVWTAITAMLHSF